MCLVTTSMTLVRSKIDVHIPRKRKGHCDQHEKALTKFFDQVMQAMLRHLNFEGWLQTHNVVLITLNVIFIINRNAKSSNVF